jgi:hypothetical protein
MFMIVCHHGAMDQASELVAFATRWHAYGGGEADDIMVTFGLTERDYFTRLLEALTTADLDTATRAAITEVARRRLHLLLDDQQRSA